MTTLRGNWIKMAPRVPPKTIIAAVGCTIWPRLPPSSNSPATMPPIASRIPAIVPLSTFQVPLGFLVWIFMMAASFTVAFLAKMERPIRRAESVKQQAVQQLPAEFHHALHDRLRALQNDKFLSAHQGNYRIGRVLHKLD